MAWPRPGNTAALAPTLEIHAASGFPRSSVANGGNYNRRGKTGNPALEVDTIIWGLGLYAWNPTLGRLASPAMGDRRQRRSTAVTRNLCELRRLAASYLWHERRDHAATRRSSTKPSSSSSISGPCDGDRPSSGCGPGDAAILVDHARARSAAKRGGGGRYHDEAATIGMRADLSRSTR